MECVMISEKESKRISKFLSYVLRHHPELIGIELDKNGWTDIGVLIEKSRRNGVELDRDILGFIVETNAKKRFAINGERDQIRANQGHSVAVDLGYEPQKPPTILFHGTGEKNGASIIQNGLEKRERHQVHLSKDVKTAREVGQRHGKPIVFEIMASEMFEAGYEFFLSENEVWLTDFVPAMYLKQHTSTH